MYGAPKIKLKHTAFNENFNWNKATIYHSKQDISISGIEIGFIRKFVVHLQHWWHVLFFPQKNNLNGSKYDLKIQKGVIYFIAGIIHLCQEKLVV